MTTFLSYRFCNVTFLSISSIRLKFAFTSTNWLCWIALSITHCVTARDQNNNYVQNLCAYAASTRMKTFFMTKWLRLIASKNISMSGMMKSERIYVSLKRSKQKVLPQRMLWRLESRSGSWRAQSRGSCLGSGRLPASSSRPQTPILKTKNNKYQKNSAIK